MVGTNCVLPSVLPLLEVSLDAGPEECVVKEMIDGLVELDWCTVIGVKPGTRSMGTSSQLQVRTDMQTHHLNHLSCSCSTCCDSSVYAQDPMHAVNLLTYTVSMLNQDRLP